MSESILNKVAAVIGLGIVSVVIRFALFEYFFAKPINQINASISKQLETASRNMDAAAPPGDAGRPNFSNDTFPTDAGWGQQAFSPSAYGLRKADRSDDPGTAAHPPKIPVPPPSSWIVFSSADAAGNRLMHARLPLSAPDGTPALTIALSQPTPARGDQGGAVQISFAAITQASCGEADALALRFDTARPVRYATKGVWVDAKCRFDVPDFPHFRDAVVNAAMLFVRVAKGNAMTQEIPAPVAGLYWTP